LLEVKIDLINKAQTRPIMPEDLTALEVLLAIVLLPCIIAFVPMLILESCERTLAASNER